jgi:hypothetical protein
MAQAKKQSLKQPMKQVIKQSGRELARLCNNTAQDQHSKASGNCRISVLTTNAHPEWCSL